MASIAAANLRKKLRLEQELLAELNAVSRDAAKTVARQVAATGRAPNLERLKPQLETVLRVHYDTVEEAFELESDAALPKSKRTTVEEAAEANAALAAFFAIRADRTAELHALGYQRAADRGAELAAIERDRIRIDESREPSDRELGIIAGSVAGRLMTTTDQRASILETEGPAEATRLTHVEVLLGASGVALTVLGGKTGPKADTGKTGSAAKEWVTQGDHRVRAAHVAADSSVVPVSEPFLVGGERMMYPGDYSLGASIGNIINCRCHVEYPVGQIARARDVEEEVELADPCEEKAIAACDVGSVADLRVPVTDSDFPEIDPDQLFDPGATETLARVRAAAPELTGAEKASVEKWITPEFAKINGALRSGTTEGFSSIVDDLDSAISKSVLPDRVVAYRGMAGVELAPGQTFTDAAFNSWSIVRDQAARFATFSAETGAPVSGGSVLRVLLPKGSNALYAGTPHVELVLGRGTTYRVVSIKEDVLITRGIKDVRARLVTVEVVE